MQIVGFPMRWVTCLSIYAKYVLQVQEKETIATEDNPQYYKSLFAYVSEQPGDLSFEAGEVIHVTNTQRDWWIGSIGERIGTFPANFVEKVEDQVSLRAKTNASQVFLIENCRNCRNNRVSLG